MSELLMISWAVEPMKSGFSLAFLLGHEHNQIGINFFGKAENGLCQFSFAFIHTHQIGSAHNTFRLYELPRLVYLPW